MDRSPPNPLLPDQLRLAVDSLDEGIAVLDANGVIVFANRLALDTLHAEEADVLGWRLLEDFEWQILNEEGEVLPRESHPALQVLRTGESQRGRVLGVRTPMLEDVLWVAVSARPMRDPEGRLIGSVSAFRDISPQREVRAAERALKRSEERFRTLVAMLPVGIVQTDRDGRCIFVNEAWQEISGRAAEDALGEGWMDAIHPEDRDRVRKLWTTDAPEGAVLEAEFRFLQPAGEVRWVAGAGVRLVGFNGEPGGLLGSVTDITAGKRAGLLKEQLIGVVSHELRAPLIAIGGALRHLAPQVDALDAHGRRLHEMAVRNAELLERMVANLLDLERLEGGVAALSMAPLQVADVLEDVEEVGLELARDKGVSIEVTRPPEPLMVTADRDRLVQVLVNLVSNAVKFSGEGGTVTIRAEADADDVRFAVRDRGRGIPEEFRERIFERFAQVEPDDARRGGSGLGLSIARAVVEQHGGRIWADSQEGEGSTFLFTLPSRR